MFQTYSLQRVKTGSVVVFIYIYILLCIYLVGPTVPSKNPQWWEDTSKGAHAQPRKAREGVHHHSPQTFLQVTCDLEGVLESTRCPCRSVLVTRHFNDPKMPQKTTKTTRPWADELTSPATPAVRPRGVGVGHVRRGGRRLRVFGALPPGGAEGMPTSDQGLKSTT